MTESSLAPTAEFAAQANGRSELFEQADADYEAFWAEQAGRLDWAESWDQVLDWSNPPFAKWFVGGRLARSAVGVRAGRLRQVRSRYPIPRTVSIVSLPIFLRR